MKQASFLVTIASLFLFSCGNKLSEKDITKKLLVEYVCADKAKVNGLKILKTEETESTPNIHVFTYTLSGEVEWPESCAELAVNTQKGTKEKFQKIVTLAKDENGNWE